MSYKYLLTEFLNFYCTEASAKRANADFFTCKNERANVNFLVLATNINVLYTCKQCWGKLLLKVMHYDIVLLPN